MINIIGGGGGTTPGKAVDLLICFKREFYLKIVYFQVSEELEVVDRRICSCPEL